MPVTIIAEAGVNHNGDLEMAKKMALTAKECGADIVKYQTAVPELVVSKFAEKAEYQKQTTDAAESQLEMIRKLHFSFEGHKELKEYCDSIGIQYLSAPFDIPSVQFLGIPRVLGFGPRGPCRLLKCPPERSPICRISRKWPSCTPLCCFPPA